MAFVSKATNLVSGVTNNQGEIYAADLRSGATIWVSTNVAAILALVNSRNHPFASDNPAISANGQYVAFKTTDGASLILRHNLQTGVTDLVSTDAVVDTVGFADATGPAMTPDGRFIGFDSRPQAVKNFASYSLQRLRTDHIDIYRPARLDRRARIPLSGRHQSSQSRGRPHAQRENPLRRRSPLLFRVAVL